MNTFLKYGSVLSCVFMLAACETPGNEDEIYNDGNAGVGAGYDDGYGSNALENEFVQNVGDRVFFATDSSVITAEGRSTLARQAEWLNNNPSVSVVVEGHADERGTREYNLALGERRANAAKNVLVASGLDASRITTISYGKERPAVMGSDPSSWAQNRRAVTVLAK